jgi:hypothetical protein
VAAHRTVPASRSSESLHQAGAETGDRNLLEAGGIEAALGVVRQSVPGADFPLIFSSVPWRLAGGGVGFGIFFSI